jgi:hypothetical protein
MARFFHNQNTFRAGQLSEKLRNRGDVAEYRQGAKTLENFEIFSTGGITKRPGIEQFGTAGVEDGQGVHIPFTIPNFYGYIQIHYRAINPTVSFLGYGTAYPVESASVRDALVAAARLDPYGFTYTQRGSYLIICHASGTMRPVVFSDFFYDTSPTFIDANFVDTRAVGTDTPVNNPWRVPEIIHRPMEVANVSAITLQPALGGSPKTLTAAGSGSAGFFTANRIGEYFILDDKNATPRVLVCKVLAITSGTVAQIEEVFTTAGYTSVATDYWYEEAWTVDKGYPKVVSSFEGRILYANNVNSPNKIWASETFLPSRLNNYIAFDNETTAKFAYTGRVRPVDSDPFNFELSLGIGDKIAWVGTSRNLFVGTESREVQLSGGDSAISAINQPQVSVVSYFGAVAQQVSYVKDNIIFIDRTKRQLIELRFSSENGSFISRNISRLSEDMMQEATTYRDNFIVRTAYVKDRNILYLLTKDSTPSFRLYAAHFSDIDDSIGFTFCRMSSLISVFDIIAIDPILTGSLITRSEDYSLLAFYRLAGETFDTGYVGRMRGEFYALPSPTNFVANTRINFLDNWLYISTSLNPPIWEIPGLLANTKYTVLMVDGSYHSYTSDGTGKITVPADDRVPGASEYIVGFPFTAKIETMPLEVGPNYIYTSRGDFFRISNADLELYRTYELEYGTNNDNEKIVYPLERDSLTPFTGLVPVNIAGSSSNDTRVVVESSSPYNACILGLVLRGINERL